MALHIDRVQTEMDVLPGSGAAEAGGGGGAASGASGIDPLLRERLRTLVMEVLRDHMRELERRGTL